MQSRSRFTLSLLSAASLWTLPGCTDRESSVPEIPAVPVVDVADAKPAAAPTSLPATGGWRRYDGISFQIPEEWQDTEAKMVDSKYIMPTEDGDIEITLTSMGGGVEANLSRWVQQMQQAPGDSPEESVMTLDGVEGKMIDVRGVYNSRVGTQTVASNSRLIGLALPIRPRDFYVRLVGPRDAVAGYYDDFRAFLKTAQIED